MVIRGKTGLVLGVISMQFKGIFLRSMYKMGIIFWVAKIPIHFFFGGGGGEGGWLIYQDIFFW